MVTRVGAGVLCGVPGYFKDVQLLRMSNGDYCLVRPLGLVRGGKGLRHHENLLRLTPSGVVSGLWRGLGLSRLLARMRQQATVPAE
jgi:hypothetical protein